MLVSIGYPFLHVRSNRRKERKLTPVRYRVVNVLKTWLESNFTKDDQVHLDRISKFIVDYIKLGMRSNRFQILTELSKLSGFGCSIGDINRFCEYIGEDEEKSSENQD